jgi:membrane associated rhomboid family serine protease
MGIYDREYYRRERPSFLGSFADRGTVCKWLIGINIICFVIQMVTRTPPRFDELTGLAVPGADPFTGALLLDVGRVLHGEVWRLLTYAFLHDPNSIWHILFNMLFLWWFGSDVEDLYGPREFLLFYLASAFLGGVAFVLAHLLGFPGTLCLGASGAVTAVLVLCAIHYPTRIIYLFFLIPVPIWLFVVFSVAMDAFTLLGHHPTGTAVAVHLGGALFGFVYYRYHLRLSNWVPAWRGLRRAEPRLRLYRGEEPTPTPVGAGVSAQGDLEQLREEVDQILEKISLVGKDSLTEHERQTLLRASEVLKRRRH